MSTLKFIQRSIFERALPTELPSHISLRLPLSFESLRQLPHSHSHVWSYAPVLVHSLPRPSRLSKPFYSIISIVNIYITNKIMAVRTGLEPATSCVTGRHSNQLNYRTKVFHVVKITNLYIILLLYLVAGTGFEPATFGL
jgi:hypothetical protein